MKIAVTGHRPNKMPNNYGYDIHNDAWAALKNRFKQLLADNKCD